MLYFTLGLTHTGLRIILTLPPIIPLHERRLFVCFLHSLVSTKDVQSIFDALKSLGLVPVCLDRRRFEVSFSFGFQCLGIALLITFILLLCKIFAFPKSHLQNKVLKGKKKNSFYSSPFHSALSFPYCQLFFWTLWFIFLLIFKI